MKRRMNANLLLLRKHFGPAKVTPGSKLKETEAIRTKEAEAEMKQDLHGFFSCIPGSAETRIVPLEISDF